MGFLVVEKIINAPLEQVWDAAKDFTKAPLSSLPITIVNKGDESNFGIGCERVIKTPIATVHERLESVNPPNSYTYTMLSGLPVNKYLAKVELFKSDGNTLAKWSLDFTPKFSGIGWIISSIMKKQFNLFIDELGRNAKV